MSGYVGLTVPTSPTYTSGPPGPVVRRAVGRSVLAAPLAVGAATAGAP